MPTTAPSTASERVDERALSKLRWRCRRGLLENDLFIQRFFSRHQECLTVKQAQALADLMSLSDNDLLDIHLGRKGIAQVDPELVRDDVLEIIALLRTPPERSI
jgi:antitoxin CptB